ncbi:MAG: thioredoxin-dependent thiol peroxidase [Aquificae bacterium]|nr:thioredoxin-dependent thiol peroxidase [Aquificota bacterium]
MGERKPLEEGSEVPNFCLRGLDPQGNEVEVCFDQFRNQKVIVYFYPKDNTPGCTTEACDFRDNLNRFKDRGITVIGISPDGVESHKRFREKYGLNFYLLSDPEKEVARLFGAYGPKKRYGKTVEGIIRSTFYVENGVVKKAWRNVRAKGHVERILKELGLS